MLITSDTFEGLLKKLGYEGDFESESVNRFLTRHGHKIILRDGQFCVDESIVYILRKKTTVQKPRLLKRERLRAILIYANLLKCMILAYCFYSIVDAVEKRKRRKKK